MKENTTYPLISVVMPIYNTARYLRKSIPSVMAQDYPNLEIVLLNNGSTDESDTIIREYAQQDHRIKFFEITHVSTVKESRDNAIARATGDWIVSVDSDDSIDNHHVSKLWLRHIETNAEWVCGRMKYKEGDKELPIVIPSLDFDMNTVMSGEEAMLRTLFNWEIGLNGSLRKRSIFSNLITEHSDFFYTDECDTRMYLNNCNKVAFADTTYWVTCNHDSVSRTPSATGILYPLITVVGLCQYFNKRYGRHSILSEGAVIQLYRVYIKSFDYMSRNIDSVAKQLNDFHKKRIKEAFLSLSDRRDIIGLCRYYRCKYLYIRYQKMLKI